MTIEVGGLGTKETATVVFELHDTEVMKPSFLRGDSLVARLDNFDSLVVHHFDSLVFHLGHF